MRAIISVVVVATGLFGCGPEEVIDPNPASGGSGGGAGAAGGAGGAAGGSAGREAGGDAGAESVARGAVEIRLSSPSTAVPNIGTRTSCTAGTTGTYTYFLGQLAQGLTAQDRVRSGLVESGQGLTVDCAVVSRAEGRYSVRASLSGVDANSRRVATSITVEGTVAANGMPTDDPATVAVYTPDTTNLRTIPDLPACTIGPVYVAKPGALLADFNCPVLADSSDTIKGCQATGTIAVERCLVADD
jgi:hypothetical protein